MQPCHIHSKCVKNVTICYNCLDFSGYIQKYVWSDAYWEEMMELVLLVKVVTLDIPLSWRPLRTPPWGHTALLTPLEGCIWGSLQFTLTPVRVLHPTLDEYLECHDRPHRFTPGSLNHSLSVECWSQCPVGTLPKGITLWGVELATSRVRCQRTASSHCSLLSPTIT